MPTLSMSSIFFENTPEYAGKPPDKSSLRGVGDALIPMLIICVGTCILRVLWVFGAGAIHPGLYTTLTSYPLSWTITSLAFLVYYYRFSAMRKLNKLIEE